MKSRLFRYRTSTNRLFDSQTDSHRRRRVYLPPKAASIFSAAWRINSGTTWLYVFIVRNISE